jgi:hypothetical protein
MSKFLGHLIGALLVIFVIVALVAGIVFFGKVISG